MSNGKVIKRQNKKEALHVSCTLHPKKSQIARLPHPIVRGLFPDKPFAMPCPRNKGNKCIQKVQ
jgi:hypothetical protein